MHFNYVGFLKNYKFKTQKESNMECLPFLFLLHISNPIRSDTHFLIHPNIQLNQPCLASPHAPTFVRDDVLWPCSMCRWSLVGMGRERSWNVSLVVEI